MPERRGNSLHPNSNSGGRIERKFLGNPAKYVRSDNIICPVPVKERGIGVRQLRRNGAQCNGSRGIREAEELPRFCPSRREIFCNLSGCRVLNYTAPAGTRGDGE